VILLIMILFILWGAGCYLKGKSEGARALSFELRETFDDWCSDNRRNRILEKDHDYEKLCDKMFDVIGEL